MKPRDLANLIYEAAVVKRVKRTGWQILGGHEETVGEHTFMTAVVAYFLGKELHANLLEVLIMAIFHDFHEGRTGEMDKLARFYVTRNQAKANRDIFSEKDNKLLLLLEQYEAKQSLEARIAYEANIVAFLVEAKLLCERGHTQAKEWFTGNAQRLKLSQTKILVKELWKTDSQIWWKSLRDQLHEEFKNE